MESFELMDIRGHGLFKIHVKRLLHRYLNSNK